MCIFGDIFSCCNLGREYIPKLPSHWWHSYWLLVRTVRPEWYTCMSWWRHQMETFSALLALCEGNSPVIGEFPSQRPVTRRFDVFFDLRLNKRLSKPSRRRWFGTPSRPLWRHYNVFMMLSSARPRPAVPCDEPDRRTLWAVCPASSGWGQTATDPVRPEAHRH